MFLQREICCDILICKRIIVIIYAEFYKKKHQLVLPVKWLNGVAIKKT